MEMKRIPWLNTDPAHWNRGVLPQPVMDVPSGLVAASYGTWMPDDVVWWDFMRPVAQQGIIPSCTGWTMAGVEELIMAKFHGRDFLPAYTHIDGELAWADQRRLKYGGDMTGGLYVTDAFRGSVNVGIFPKDTYLRQVAPEPHDMCDAMRTSPIMAATRVHAGYFELDEHGGVNEWRDPGPGDAGHEWIIVGILHQGNRWFVSGLTSWGPLYGKRGCFLMSIEELEQSRIAPLFSIANPNREWRGWQNCLCRVNERGERMAA